MNNYQVFYNKAIIDDETIYSSHIIKVRISKERSKVLSSDSTTFKQKDLAIKQLKSKIKRIVKKHTDAVFYFLDKSFTVEELIKELNRLSEEK